MNVNNLYIIIVFFLNMIGIYIKYRNVNNDNESNEKNGPELDNKNEMK